MSLPAVHTIHEKEMDGRNGNMQKETLYLKLERNVELPSEEVCMLSLIHI